MYGKKTSMKKSPMKKEVVTKAGVAYGKSAKGTIKSAKMMMKKKMK